LVRGKTLSSAAKEWWEGLGEFWGKYRGILEVEVERWAETIMVT